MEKDVMPILKKQHGFRGELALVNVSDGYVSESP
jgi:hypothetical protein